jgi:hypothetical protein
MSVGHAYGVQMFNSGSAAESAHQIDDEHYQENQTNAATTDGWTANIKSAAAEQKKDQDNKKQCVHYFQTANRESRSTKS